MSSIQDFYRDQTIFLTGATGFLGKLILEKLLRTCAVQKVYILVRPKHDKTLQQRFHSIFDSAVSNLELIKNHLDHEIFFKALVRVILFVGVTASRPLSL
jgi:FlaA1/EpsC-like NDP-sugar epimerase